MKRQHHDSNGQMIPHENAERPADSQFVMLSCRIPSGLRRRLKMAAFERGLQMAQLVEQAIVRELDRLDRNAE